MRAPRPVPPLGGRDATTAARRPRGTAGGRGAGSGGGRGRAGREQGQHVLQLVAEAEGAAALARAAAAPQAGGEQLVGQPVVDQAVEGGLAGLDPQIAQRARPRSAWSRRARARPRPASRVALGQQLGAVEVRRLAQRDGDRDASPCAGTSTVPAKLAMRRPSSPAVSSRAAVRRRSRVGEVVLGTAEEAVADMLLVLHGQRGRRRTPSPGGNRCAGWRSSRPCAAVSVRTCRQPRVSRGTSASAISK